MTGPGISEMRRALGRELAALREQASLTQRQLASLIGYSRSTIGDAELGRKHIPRGFWERSEIALNAGTVLSGRYDQIERRPRQEPPLTCPACHEPLRVMLAVRR